MIPRLILLIVLFCNLYTSEGRKGNLELPDYDYYRNRHYVDKQNLRERFLQRKNEKRAKDARIKLLNIYSSKDTLTLDGVAHVLINKKSSNWDTIYEIEEGIKKINAAVGLNYVYKRDHYWRTWKKVKYPNNVTRIVCYKCNNIINATCENCRNSGFWTIEEEPPPCPLELYSVIDPQQACGIKFTELYNYTDPCPVTLNFAEIMSNCDNPIKTSYRITKSFKESKSLPTAICGEADYCEISTFYRIYKDYILFKVINSSNDVIYSRVMKPRRKNFACTENCGRMDSNRNNVTNEIPLSVNLLPKRSVEQENSLQKLLGHNTIATKRRKKKQNDKSQEPGKRKKSKKSLRSYKESLKSSLESIKNLIKKVKTKYLSNDTKAATESTCTRLGKQATTTTEDYEDKYVDYTDNAFVAGE